MRITKPRRASTFTPLGKKKAARKAAKAGDIVDSLTLANTPSPPLEAPAPSGASTHSRRPSVEKWVMKMPSLGAGQRRRKVRGEPGGLNLVGTTATLNQMVLDELQNSGLSAFSAQVVATPEGLKGIRKNGRATALKDGLYTFGIDQSGRLMIAGVPNKKGSAKHSAQGGKETSKGSHTFLSANLPGYFFGEIEVRGGVIVAFNNRSGTYRNSAAMAVQAQLHPLLRHAEFFAVPGSWQTSG